MRILSTCGAGLIAMTLLGCAAREPQVKPSPKENRPPSKPQLDVIGGKEVGKRNGSAVWQVVAGEKVAIQATSTDPDQDPLTYTWDASHGLTPPPTDSKSASTDVAKFQWGDAGRKVLVTCSVTDGHSRSVLTAIWLETVDDATP